jgi:hypothetical protein
MDMPDMPHNLHAKAGPFPVWVWGAAVGVLVVGVMWYRRSSGGTAVAPDTTGTAYDPNALDNAALYSGNDRNAANATYATTSMQRTARTNLAWLRQVVQYEAGKGRNPITAQRAFMRYLQGKPLTEKQNKIVSDALVHVGIPPKPPKVIPPTKSNNPPSKHPGSVFNDGPKRHRKRHHAAATATRTTVTAQTHEPDANVREGLSGMAGMTHTSHTADSGDTAASMAHRVYGKSTPYHTERIRRANGIGSTDQFVPGQTVKVPQ